MASKKQIKQYEIYLADLNPTRGSELKKTRPVVVVFIIASDSNYCNHMFILVNIKDE